MTRRAVLLVAAALLGIAATAAVAWTASQLAGQRIGLSSEPLSVASGLAPGHESAASPGRPSPGRRVRPAVTPRRAAAPSTAPAPAGPTSVAPAPATPASSPHPATTGPPVAPSAPSGSSSSSPGRVASAQSAGQPRDDSSGASRDSGAHRDD